MERGNHAWANVKHIDDMGKQFVKELEDFFVNFYKLKGRKYLVLDVKGPKQALKSIKQGLRAAKRK